MSNHLAYYRTRALAEAASDPETARALHDLADIQELEYQRQALPAHDAERRALERLIESRSREVMGLSTPGRDESQERMRR